MMKAIRPDDSYHTRSSMSYIRSSDPTLKVKPGSLIFCEVDERFYVVIEHLSHALHRVYCQVTQQVIEINMAPNQYNGYTDWKVIHEAD